MQKTSPGGPAVSHAKKRRLNELAQGSKLKALKASQQGAGSNISAASTIVASSGLTEFPYTKLPQEILDSILSKNAQVLLPDNLISSISSSAPINKPAIQKFVEVLLATNNTQRGDTLAAAVQRVVDKTVMLENPISNPGSANAQAGLNRSKTPKYSRNLRSRSQSGSIVEQLKDKTRRGRCVLSYDSLLPLHTLWFSYMSKLGLSIASTPTVFPTSHPPSSRTLSSADKLTRSTSSQPPAPGCSSDLGGGLSLSDARLLIQADLHGCLMTVSSSRQACHVGVTGIAAAVTAQVVCLVSQDNRLHVVPKAGSVFEYTIPSGRVLSVRGEGWMDKNKTAAL
ncbi:hypothetical protein CEUSTIGMA_g10406.t1 [Chlamydomonas eustigma]|uniref:Uncharacterized protein n=1 Tax=Chlamydomonas eustigma TaxID=1157962 RepID=A0A250XJ83_9CHLO|nr:hypothetical protein CEUSTIGMA_g10406.t1 [Chlamydomonas eustigma]|eukprot:GAX82979.1 hypothetical protein CEUSTIGMA_g10406.t1 [Chlamydomonas eustigma]